MSRSFIGEASSAGVPAHRLAASLWAGTPALSASPMKDRDIFDLLGFD